MNDMTDMVNNEDTPLAKVAGETMKYNTASVNALATNVGLQAKYGSGMGGVETLESQLQQYQAKRVYESVMDDVLDKTDPSNKITHDRFDIQKSKERLGLK
jgi:hypothetical protein